MIRAITEFFSNHGYVAEVFLSCMIFTIKLPKRKLFAVRVIVCVACFLGISFLFNYLESLFPEGGVPNYLPMIRYSLCYVIVVMSIWFDFGVKYLIALFLGISSVATQHFSYKTGELVSRLLSPYITDGWSIAVYVAVLLSSYAAIYFLFAGKLKNLESEYLEVKQTIYIAIALVLYTTMFQYSTSIQMNYYVIYALYDMLCCAFTLMMQVNALNAGKYMHEYKVSEYINYQSKEQYDLAKKNIELLNVKFHDLKKMISNMGADISLDEKYELERAISIYDTTIQTGNEVLDVILTEKSMFCDQVGIRFERIVDGSLLGFISHFDLYSLIGNALDNAIEAVLKIDNPEERVISLMIRKAKGVVLIHIDNRFVGEITFVDGLPETTKDNKLYHGYGIKSIRNVVEKYDGILDVSAKNGLFEINVVFVLDGAKTGDKL